MAYLDDSGRASGWIVVLTLPAIALIGFRLLSTTMAVDSGSGFADVLSALEAVSRVNWISPLFVLIQFSMIARGTASMSWQNVLCIVLTAAGGFMMWQTRLGLD